MHEQYQSCIEACNRCAAECEHCASACLHEENVQKMARCIDLDHQCAVICRVAAGFMARGSEFATDICRVCGEICRACGEECRKHDVEHCQRCADACEHCAEECERMASAHA